MSMLRWFSQDVEHTAPGSRKGCDFQIKFFQIKLNQIVLSAKTGSGQNLCISNVIFIMFFLSTAQQNSSKHARDRC